MASSSEQRWRDYWPLVLIHIGVEERGVGAGDAQFDV
jgi:hypothetical protein